MVLRYYCGMKSADTADERSRCSWAKHDLYTIYHDTEWGVPSHDDRHLLELLILEGAQAGLSWETILNKRLNYKQVFCGFDAEKIADFDETRIQALLANPGIVRNRAKVYAAVANARAFLKVQEEFGSFDRYIWSFVGGRPIQNGWVSVQEAPTVTAESKAMSKDLTRRGFKFVGPTICYAYMQAVGMVNDHLRSCFRWRELQ